MSYCMIQIAQHQQVPEIVLQQQQQRQLIEQLQRQGVSIFASFSSKITISSLIWLRFKILFLKVSMEFHNLTISWALKLIVNRCENERIS